MRGRTILALLWACSENQSETQNRGREGARGDREPLSPVKQREAWFCLADGRGAAAAAAAATPPPRPHLWVAAEVWDSQRQSVRSRASEYTALICLYFISGFSLYHFALVACIREGEICASAIQQRLRLGRAVPKTPSLL